MEEQVGRAKALQLALQQSTMKPGAINNKLTAAIKDLQALQSDVAGNFAKNEIGEKGMPLLEDRMFAIYRGIERSTYGPTETHKQQLAIVEAQQRSNVATLNTITKLLDVVEGELKDAGAPPVKY